jgi:hypothetical protein
VNKSKEVITSWSSGAGRYDNKEICDITHTQRNFEKEQNRERKGGYRVGYGVAISYGMVKRGSLKET